MPLGISDFDRWERKLRRPPAPREIEDIPLRRRRTVISEESENTQIAKNRETSQARAEHPFKRAQWTDEGGHARCLTCGNLERTDNDDNTLSCVPLAVGEHNEGDDGSGVRATTAGGQTAAEDPGRQPEGVRRDQDEFTPDDARQGSTMVGSEDHQDGNQVVARADKDQLGEIEVSPVSATYSDGIMHAHLGGGPHFHELRKGADRTGMAADAQGVELTKQHAHPVAGGVIKADDADRTATGVEELPRFIQQRAKDLLDKSDINAHDYHFDDKGLVGGRPFVSPPLSSQPEATQLKRPTSPDEPKDDKLDKVAYPDDAPPADREERPRVGKSIRDLLPLLDEQFSAPYQIIRKAEGDNADELRMTTGVVYPVYDPERNAPGSDSPFDAHGDAATRDEVRMAAWRFAKNGLRASGLQHKGAGGAGTVVESWTFPDFLGKTVVKDVDGNEQTLVPGDWLATAVWTPEAWSEIKKGRYTGWSLQGTASRQSIDE